MCFIPHGKLITASVLQVKTLFGRAYSYPPDIHWESLFTGLRLVPLYECQIWDLTPSSRLYLCVVGSSDVGSVPNRTQLSEGFVQKNSVDVNM